MNILKILIVVMFVPLTGCAPLVLNIKDPSPQEVVKLNVEKIEFINSAKVETGGPSVLADSIFPCPEDMQLQFHEAIKRNAVNPVIITGSASNERAIIRINRAVVMRTVKGVKGIPILGILFLGIKEDYSAIIEGVIEIEDEQKRVIHKADFSSSATIKGDATTVEQIKEGASNVINEVLISLQKEIVEQSKRYLYKHLL